MKRLLIPAVLTGTALLLGQATSAFALDPSWHERSKVTVFKASLDGYQEVPAVSTTGEGKFRATLSDDRSAINFELSYRGLEGVAAASHIHFGKKGTNGSVIAFLCGGPTPPCPPDGGVVTGTITAGEIIGPEAQGIAAGEFDEALRAMMKEIAYVNVHTSKHAGGEIRGEIDKKRMRMKIRPPSPEPVPDLP